MTSPRYGVSGVRFELLGEQPAGGHQIGQCDGRLVVGDRQVATQRERQVGAGERCRVLPGGRARQHGLEGIGSGADNGFAVQVRQR